MRPAVPEYWRCTPQDLSPFLRTVERCRAFSEALNQELNVLAEGMNRFHAQYTMIAMALR
jgi:hypothetical protein